MKKLEKYGYWLMLSDYDLDTIDCLIEGERWVYVAYLCQQATERQLKGMYVYYMDAEAPKTHNVNFLFNKILASKAFREEVDQKLFEERRTACEDFLVDAMFYYMSDYPFSYKNIKTRFVEKELALALYKNAKDYIAWLRSFQPQVDMPNV
ncbi:MAG: HEPN domain-containing protein [Clostridiaceae bacterium]|nr:HEPN domain-containing protein [Clostridiaceae bacterium]